MFDRITTRIASFGLAALTTLALLSGIDALASTQHAAAQMARAQPAATTAQSADTAKAAAAIRS
jgi:hypothetical protein